MLGGPALACVPARGSAAISRSFLTQVNDLRGQSGLRKLHVEARLARAALAHACDNARRRSYGHRGGDGSTLAQRLARVQYPYRAAAENTGWGFRSATSALRWWLRSPPHRANLMNPALRDIGIGIALGGDEKLYWVLDLGTR
ncbi:Allergen V5/Tpx-1 family protein [Defluviimonas sp. 20V17]|nr:Allergen V5/Tpx-1 family protein [Defluviimonas sp. 20V17]